MKIEWTKHLPEDRKEDFEKTLRNNTLIFKRMYDILQEWEKTVLSEERSKDQYKSPAWAELQAHRNGNLEMINKLKDLISL